MTETLSFQELLSFVSSNLETEGLKAVIELPARGSITVQPDPPLPEPLASRLASKGIEGLWTHQAQALAALRRGENTTVSTGTASGKSLCFNLPVIERILTDKRARAIYVYPTKALAQDQLRALRSFGLPEISAATYDGDTPAAERASVRRYANIVLTNPEMLHFGILPYHAKWAPFLGRLEFVVVDEAHVLKGVFGSHVGCVLRRLLRLARHYRADPRFVLTSATTPNPSQLAERLLGVPFTEVTEDGAPKGPRTFAFWNPPFVDETMTARTSANWESARLMAAFADRDIRTLTFAKSRKAAELIAKHTRNILDDPERRRKVTAYRGGYLAQERREIEQRLFAGELLGVAATSALELGIDVGGLDAVVLNGFPGTVAQVWQQAGRAGRSQDPSVAVMVGRDDPLDQYYIAHPDILMSKPFETALVDITNPNILEPHLACAAFELPIGEEEVVETFGLAGVGAAARLVELGVLVLRKSRGAQVPRYHYRGATPPGAELDLRSMGGPMYSIVEEDTGALLGTVDGASAFSQVYPGAIYLHQGENWEVVELDLARHVALVKKASGSYYTQSRDVSDITVLEVRESKTVGAVTFYLGRVEVARQVVAFARKDISTGEVLDLVDLDLPEVVLDTIAFWYTVEERVIARARIAPRRPAGDPARRRTLRHRDAPAVCDGGSVGHRRGEHRLLTGHRAAHRLHLRRLPGRRRHRRTRVCPGRGASRGHAGGSAQLPL